MGKKIINIVGASASGKTTLVHAILEKETGVAEIVSDTSREVRKYANEVNGIDYYFRTPEEMKTMADNNEFAEFNIYTGTDMYGIRKSEISDKFKDNDVLFVITDINGNKQLKEVYGDDIITVYIMVEEYMIKERLEKRGDSKENIEKRLKKLHDAKELENYKYADFVVLNKNLDYACNQLKDIVNSFR